MTVGEFYKNLDLLRRALEVLPVGVDDRTTVAGVWMADTTSSDYPECYSDFKAEDLIVVYLPKTNELFIGNEGVIHSE